MAQRLAAKLIVVPLPQARAALVNGRAFNDLSANRAGIEQHAARDGGHRDYRESDDRLQRHGATFRSDRVGIEHASITTTKKAPWIERALARHATARDRNVLKSERKHTSTR